MKVMIAGGGTAGHVNPAISLARALAGDEVVFLGTSRGVEADLVPRAGYPIETVEVRGFDRARPWALPATGVRAAGAVFQARGVLRRHGPSAVVGMGGYVSLPAVMAAASLRVPVVLHEQNIVLGLAHKVSKPFAKKIAVSFEETLAEAGAKGVFVGNPIGADLVDFDRASERARGRKQFGLDPARRTLLVFGGSLGARRINEAAVGLATEWRDRTDVQVLHITGRAGFPELDAQVGDAGSLIYRMVPFAERMIEAYAAADLTVCRGGATTVAELAAVGLPALIVPYPFHRDRQQERHGRVLEKAGGARVVADQDLTPGRLAADAGSLLADEGKLVAMREALLALARPEAARRLAAVVQEVARADR